MEQRHTTTTGKISQRLKGLGTVTGGMVDQRAIELAAIAGRTRSQVTEDDRRTAREELTGAVQTGSAEESSQEMTGSSQWGANPGTSGGRVPPVAPQDEQAENERLVQDGVNEAEHDTMVRGARSSQNQG